MKYKDILIRALKTFIQGFLASLVVFLQGQQTLDEKIIKGALIGAIAGGISALMNFIINYLEKGDDNMCKSDLEEIETNGITTGEETEEATEKAEVNE